MNSKLKILNLIYFTQLAVLVLFSIVVFYLNSTNPLEDNPTENGIFVYIPFIILLFAFPASNLLFKTYLSSNLNKHIEIGRKISTYQVGTLLRTSILEMAGLIAVVFSLITSQNLLLFVVGFVIILFLITRPTLYKIQQDIGVSREELDMLD